MFLGFCTVQDIAAGNGCVYFITQQRAWLRPFMFCYFWDITNRLSTKPCAADLNVNTYWSSDFFVNPSVHRAQALFLPHIMWGRDIISVLGICNCAYYMTKESSFCFHSGKVRDRSNAPSIKILIAEGLWLDFSEICQNFEERRMHDKWATQEIIYITVNLVWI